MIPDATVQMRHVNIDKLRRMKQEAELQIALLCQAQERGKKADRVVVEIVTADYLFLLLQLETL